MAIEFNCPYCTATIRVPDAYSGKKGSCPKCATKLLVPNVAPQSPDTAAPLPPPTPHPQPEQPLVESPPSAAASIPAPSMPADAVASAETPVSEFPAPPVAPSEPTAAVPGLDSATGGDMPTFAPPSPTTTMGRKLRKKSRRKKSQRLYTLGIPIVCFLLFFGVVAAITLLRQPELKGTLRGTVASNMEIPVVTVPISDFGLTTDEESKVFQAFEDAPEAFISSQMSCRISLDGSSLAINVKKGKSGFTWFAVNPRTDVTLADWIRDNQISINKQRLRQVVKTGKEFCSDKVLKADGTPVVMDAARYRDAFGIAAHVSAFGYVIEAVTANNRSLCAHEDGNGILYFSLPEGTQSFRLRGRSLGNSNPLFPGEYVVKVEGSASTTTPPAADESSDANTDSNPSKVEDMDSDDASDEDTMNEPPSENEDMNSMKMEDA